MATPPVPAGLTVEVRHEGVVVTTSALAGRAVVALGIAALGWLVGGAALLGGAAFVAGIAAVAGSGLGVLVAIGASPGPWQLAIRDRWIDVRDLARLGGRPFRVELDALQRWYVAEPREDYGGYALVLVDGRETRRIGEGLPKAELEWIVAAIGEAVETKRRRERVEGREWGFQKQAPAPIRTLVERE